MSRVESLVPGTCTSRVESRVPCAPTRRVESKVPGTCAPADTARHAEGAGERLSLEARRLSTAEWRRRSVQVGSREATAGVGAGMGMGMGMGWCEENSFDASGGGGLV